MTQQDLLEAVKQLSDHELGEFVAQLTAICQERESETITEDATPPEGLTTTFPDRAPDSGSK